MPETPSQNTPTPPKAESSFSFASIRAAIRAAIWADFIDAVNWCKANPLPAILITVLVGAVVYFYTGIKVFQNATQTSWEWMTSTWNKENDQEHGWVILPISLLLVLMNWRKIKAAPKAPSNWGIPVTALGVLFFLAGVRCTQGRYAILAISFLILGSVMYLWGTKTARLILFPCVFLWFMIPIGGIIQGTVGLQVFTAKVIHTLSNLCGIPLSISGADISSPTGQFAPMEVAGGCSGIRSLMAMMTLAALYSYFSMKGVFRGLVLFGCSLGFAVIGNFVRVFSVVLFAVFINPERALELYHNYSGFVFFPVAVLAMVAFGNFLNRDWGKWWKKITTSPENKDGDVKPGTSGNASGPVSYDY